MLKRPALADALGVLLTLTLLFTGGGIFGDPGMGWHLRAGEFISTHGVLNYSDPFLSPPSGLRQWIHDQWLGDVAIWHIYRFGGFPLLRLAVIICCVGSVVVVLAPLLRARSSGMNVFLVIFAISMLASIQWFLRPLMFSFLLFSVIYRISCLWYSGEKVSGLWLLPLIFLLWANLHAGFVLGLFVMAAAIGLKLVTEKRITGAFQLSFVISALFTLINPWGPKLYSSVFSLASSKYFLLLNEEWLSPDLQSRSFAGVVLLLLIFAALGTGAGRKELTAFDRALLVIFMLLSLLHRRYIPYLAIVSALPLVKLLAPLEDASGLFASFRRGEQRAAASRYTCALWLLLLLTILIRGSVPGTRENTPALAALPEPVVKMLAAAEPGLIFHGPDLGGSMTWQLWPKQKAWLDDRNQLLGPQIYEDWLNAAAARPDWQKIFEQYKFNWALMPSSDPLSAALSLQDAWQEVYKSEDENGLILFNRSGTR